MVLRELYEVLVHVEHDTDRDNQYDRVDVRADELAYDIPVENAEMGLSRSRHGESAAYGIAMPKLCVFL